MKKLLFTLALLHATPYTYAGSSLSGEYLCNNCQGYLTVKPNKANTYKIWLGVGSGSCGGEVYAKSDAAQATGSAFTLTWKLKNKVCKTRISIQGKDAFVSDSCVQPDDEEDSTCAVLGDYTKRESKG